MAESPSADVSGGPPHVRLPSAQERVKIDRLANAAFADFEKGSFLSEERHWREVLAIETATYGPSHAQVGGTLGLIGGALFQQRKFDEARPLLEQAWDITAKTLGPDSKDARFSQMLLAYDLDALRDFDTARTLAEAVETAAKTDPKAQQAVDLARFYSALIRPMNDHDKGQLRIFNELVRDDLYKRVSDEKLKSLPQRLLAEFLKVDAIYASTYGEDSVSRADFNCGNIVWTSFYEITAKHNAYAVCVAGMINHRGLMWSWLEMPDAEYGEIFKIFKSYCGKDWANTAKQYREQKSCYTTLLDLLAHRKSPSILIRAALDGQLAQSADWASSEDVNTETGQQLQRESYNYSISRIRRLVPLAAANRIYFRGLVSDFRTLHGLEGAPPGRDNVEAIAARDPSLEPLLSAFLSPWLKRPNYQATDADDAELWMRFARIEAARSEWRAAALGGDLGCRFFYDVRHRNRREPDKVTSSSRLTIGVDCPGEVLGYLTRADAVDHGKDPVLREKIFFWMQANNISSAGTALSQAGALNAARAAGVGETAAAHEAAVLTRQSLISERSEAYDRRDDKRAEALEQQWNMVDAKLDVMAAELAKRAPRYWDLRSPQPISLDALQSKSGEDAALLREEEALITIQTTRTEVYVFAVSKSATAWVKAKVTPTDISETVAYLLCDLDSTRCPLKTTVGARAKFDRARAYRLYRDLFGDPSVADVIRPAHTLLIVAKGALTSLPFGLLVTAPPKGSDDDAVDLRDTSWLMKEKAIAVLPSVNSLRTVRILMLPTRTSLDEPFLGVAPIFGGSPIAKHGLVRNAQSYFRAGAADASTLSSLPALDNVTEVTTVQQTLGGKKIVGGEATEGSIYDLDRAGDLSRTRVILFATHGLIFGDFGLAEPALALSLPSQRPTDNPEHDDGLLTASEITGLHLNADWVILSACNTGGGEYPEAEGLSGLARAFFYAGANTLLVSHWSVADRDAVDVTTRAIASRRLRADSATALQNAQQAIMNDVSRDDTTLPRSHPSAWAAFSLVGPPLY